MPKKIVFKFLGGPKDGETLIGRVGSQGEAEGYYLLTNRGRLGQQFHTASEYAVEAIARRQGDEPFPRFQRHVYEIADSFEDEEKVFIRARYVQPDRPRGDR
jgi:hypothetical protein